MRRRGRRGHFGDFNANLDALDAGQFGQPGHDATPDLGRHFEHRARISNADRHGHRRRRAVAVGLDLRCIAVNQATQTAGALYLDTVDLPGRPASLAITRSVISSAPRCPAGLRIPVRSTPGPLTAAPPPVPRKPQCRSCIGRRHVSPDDGVSTTNG